MLALVVVVVLTVEAYFIICCRALGHDHVTLHPRLAIHCTILLPAVGIICSGSNVSALGTYALPRTGIFWIGKLQLAYSSIKVVKKNKNRGVKSD